MKKLFARLINVLERLPGKPWMWAALICVVALAPKSIVTENELHKKGKWSEYFVYALAAERMRNNEAIHVLPNSSEAIAAREKLSDRVFVNIDELEKNTQPFKRKLETHVFAYPPAAATLSLPLVLSGSYLIGMIAFYLACIGGLIIAVILSYRFAIGGYTTQPENPMEVPGLGALQRLSKLNSDSVTRYAFVLITLALGAAELVAPVGQLQNDSLIFASAMLGVWSLAHKREVLAGVLFGLAGAVKGPLLLFLPWLLLTKRYKSFALALLTLFVSNFAADAFFQSSSGKLFFFDWLDNAVLPSLREGGASAAAEGIWSVFSETNQALAATMNRLFLARGDASVLPAIVELSESTVKRISYVALASLLVVSAWAMRWRAKMVPTINQEEQGKRLFGQVAIILLLGLLMSPKTSPAHLCMTFPALLVVAKEVWLYRRRLLISLAVILALGIVLLHKDLVGKTAVEYARFYGWGTLSLLLLLGINLASHVSVDAVESDPESFS